MPTDETDDAIIGDGVLTLEPPINGETTMPREIDPTIANQMDQNFANFNQELNRSAMRHQDTAEFVSEQSKAQFLLSQQLVGAKAAGQLDRDALAKGVLDQRSASGQPQAAG